MFGKRRFNSLFGDFDSLFNEMNSMFNDTPHYIKGKSNVENGNDENGKWTKESFISDDGSYSITTIVRTNTKGTKPEVSNTKLDQLKKELTTAVEEQEFETAAKLRDQIKTIESNKEKIDEIQSKLDEAVNKQDFESAIKLRDKLNKLKS